MMNWVAILSSTKRRDITKHSVIVDRQICTHTIIMEIITVFSARLYGSHSRKNQKFIEAAKVLIGTVDRCPLQPTDSLTKL
ncbi:MAG: hypothetical protein WB791_02675 [Waddliaceae bacterium]